MQLLLWRVGDGHILKFNVKISPFGCGSFWNYANSFSPLLIVFLLFPERLPSGDFAALAYLWNPFTIVACVGLSTSAIENLMVVLSLYGACSRKQLITYGFNFWTFRFYWLTPIIFKWYLLVFFWLSFICFLILKHEFCLALMKSSVSSSFLGKFCGNLNF